MNDSANDSRDMQASHDGQYKKDSLSLIGAVAMGTGVMIGAGVFALTGSKILLCADC